MSTRITYRPEIDGLRTIAVLSVVFYHAGFIVSERNLVPGGYLGVDIFFVISGYLISSLIVKGVNEGSFSFSDFYERRARRILPILFTVMLVSMPFAWYYLLPQPMSDYLNSVLYSILFSSNFWFWSQDPYWATDSALKPFLHTWSLAIEEQFYFLMPVVLILLCRYAKKALLWILTTFALCSLAFAEWSSFAYPEFSFYMLPSRMWELLAGTLLAVAELRNGRNPQILAGKFLPAFGLLLVMSAFFYFSEDTKHPSTITLAPIIGTMLIIWFARPDEPVTKLLSSKPMVGLGLLSYGLYLWHFPIFAFSKIAFGSLSNMQSLLLVISSILLAVSSYFSIEKPFRQRNRISLRRLSTCLGLSIVVLVPFLLLGQPDGFKGRFPDFLSTQDRPEDFDNQRWYKTDQELVGRIILVGDSHMIAIANTLKGLALKSGYDFSKSTFRGCQLIVEANRVRKKDYKPHKCSADLNHKRLEFIKKSPPSYVVVGGRLPLILEESRFDNQEGGSEGEMKHLYQNRNNSLKTIEERQEFIALKYKKSILEIIDAGHRVILIYPVPEVGWHVPRRMLRNIDGDFQRAKEIVMENPITTGYGVFTQRTRLSYLLLDSIQSDQISRVYAEKLFCNTTVENRCIAHDGEHVYYRDDDHLSEYGAELLSTVILAEISAQATQVSKGN